MTDQHPITPSPELVQQWLGEYFGTTVTGEISGAESALATSAARWGADQELAACCADLRMVLGPAQADWLRSVRRPKPPSLAEQALKELTDWTDQKHGPGGDVFVCEGLSVVKIRRALERLRDLEDING